ncbi:transposase family protein [Streptomyces sp. NPDC012616]|uniref:transposase family protein n=1 Tax=Streptomyces sp. NPDC012616 TaxID=3364840 RepID=UPI0036E5E39E
MEQAACPACGTLSARVHSRYARRLAGSAVGGRPVPIALQVRRFRCGEHACEPATFAEQVDGPTFRYGTIPRPRRRRVCRTRCGCSKGRSTPATSSRCCANSPSPGSTMVNAWERFDDLASGPAGTGEAEVRRPVLTSTPEQGRRYYRLRPRHGRGTSWTCQAGLRDDGLGIKGARSTSGCDQMCAGQRFRVSRPGRYGRFT